MALATALLVTVGCAPRYTYDAADPEMADEAPRQDVVHLKLVLKDGSKKRVNDLSKALHTGDKLALVVKTSAPRYLYFVNLAPDGSRQLLAMDDPDGPHQGTRRVPNDGWLNLAGQSGLELLAVVASREPMPLGRRGEQMLYRLVERTAERTDLVKLQSPSPPDFTNAGYATMGVRAESIAMEESTIRVNAPGDHTVVLIDLDHLPR